MSETSWCRMSGGGWLTQQHRGSTQPQRCSRRGCLGITRAGAFLVLNTGLQTVRKSR